MMVPENISDDDLLRRALAGDEAAFVLLYKRRQAGIYRYALHMCGSRIIAEDVTQEVFMALIRVENLNYDPSRGSLAAYLYGIARHHVLRCLERDKSYVPLADESEESAMHAAAAAATTAAVTDDTDLFADFARKEMIGQLHAAIATLPAHYREALVLCDLHELSYAEAAVVIDCAIGTVRSRLHRARSLLIEKLRPAARNSGVDSESETEEASRTINPVRCLI
jgi:RNA polymerase sigma-70 factor (ECF subfamily)